MKDEEIEDAIKFINEWKQEDRFRKRVDKWIRVRCMSFGSMVLAAMFAIGSWAMEHLPALGAAVEAFVKATGKK